jgi:hypothetical protein
MACKQEVNLAAGMHCVQVPGAVAREQAAGVPGLQPLRGMQEGLLGAAAAGGRHSRSTWRTSCRGVRCCCCSSGQGGAAAASLPPGAEDAGACHEDGGPHAGLGSCVPGGLPLAGVSGLLQDKPGRCAPAASFSIMFCSCRMNSSSWHYWHRVSTSQHQLSWNRRSRC